MPTFTHYLHFTICTTTLNVVSNYIDGFKHFDSKNTSKVQPKDINN